MSSDDSSNPTPQDRREAVRTKAQQVQAKQARARAIRVTSVGLGIAAIVAITAVVVTWAVSSSVSAPRLQPVTASQDGFRVTDVSGVAVMGMTEVASATPVPTDSATPTATPTAARGTVDIRIYVDYLSMGSQEFQLANVSQLSKWVTQESATVTYYPVALLTAKSSGTKYSLRAASASACVATQSPDSFYAFNNALLAQQPAADSPGMTNEELADLAVATGASEPRRIRRCIESESYTAWARDATDRALAGIPDADDLTLTGAPLVLVNGTPYVGALGDPREFAQFVLTTASDAYYQTPTPTPTPSPTS